MSRGGQSSFTKVATKNVFLQNQQCRARLDPDLAPESLAAKPHHNVKSILLQALVGFCDLMYEAASQGCLTETVDTGAADAFCDFLNHSFEAVE